MFNDSEVNGLAGAVLDRLTAAGFTGGTAGNNDKGKVTESQVLAAKDDDRARRRWPKELGGLPVKADASVPPGTVRSCSPTVTTARSGQDGRC